MQTTQTSTHLVQTSLTQINTNTTLIRNLLTRIVQDKAEENSSLNQMLRLLEANDSQIVQIVDALGQNFENQVENFARVDELSLGVEKLGERVSQLGLKLGEEIERVSRELGKVEERMKERDEREEKRDDLLKMILGKLEGQEKREKEREIKRESEIVSNGGRKMEKNDDEKLLNKNKYEDNMDFSDKQEIVNNPRDSEYDKQNKKVIQNKNEKSIFDQTKTQKNPNPFLGNPELFQSQQKINDYINRGFSFRRPDPTDRTENFQSGAQRFERERPKHRNLRMQMSSGRQNRPRVTDWHSHIQERLEESSSYADRLFRENERIQRELNEIERRNFTNYDYTWYNRDYHRNENYYRPRDSKRLEGSDHYNLISRDLGRDNIESGYPIDLRDRLGMGRRRLFETRGRNLEMRVEKPHIYERDEICRNQRGLGFESDKHGLGSGDFGGKIDFFKSKENNTESERFESRKNKLGSDRRDETIRSGMEKNIFKMREKGYDNGI